jgi:hypothetical protein
MDLTFVYFTQINFIHFIPNNIFNIKYNSYKKKNIKCAITIKLEIKYQLWSESFELGYSICLSPNISNLPIVIKTRLDSTYFQAYENNLYK